MIELIINELRFLWGNTNWLSRLMVGGLMLSVLGFLPYVPLAHLPFVFVAIVLCMSRYKKIELSVFLLMVYIPFSILIANPDPVFRSWQRYALFLPVLLFASPFFNGAKVAELRSKVLFAYLGVCALVSIGSFFCYFWGINYMRNVYGGSIIDYVSSAGGFGGLTIQSMKLGPMSGMGALYFFFRYLNMHRKKKFWIIAAIVICLLTCLLAASRAAFIAALSGGLIMLYLSNRSNGGFIASLFTILMVAMLTLPLWEGATAGIIQKQEANKELGQFGSRDIKWNARMNEFKASPITGIGFSAIDPNGIDEYIKETGNIEPGSSWLAILSMTGIIGFILFVNIIRKPIAYLFVHHSSYNVLVMGLLVFVLTHMIAEGFIYAGGGEACFRTWLIIGCSYDQIYGYYKKRESKI